MSVWIPPEEFYPQLPRKYSSVGLIIPYKDKYLLVKNRGKNKLSLVGGVSELNESWIATAIREAKEEIGIDIELNKLANVTYQKQDKNLPGRGDCFHAIFFTKPLTDEQYNNIKIQEEEILEYVLMSKDDIYKAKDKIIERIFFAFEGSFYNEIEP